MRYHQGGSFEGVWKADFPWEGKMTDSGYFKGGTYTGMVAGGRRHGQGTYLYEDGRRFEGTWEDDRPTEGKSFDPAP